MHAIPMLENLYGKAITEIKAYGVDEFDFIRNILGVDFSVGQFGYVVFEFGDSCFYISVDGISSVIPPKNNVIELSIHKPIKDTFVGVVLQSISFDGNQYYIQFDGLELLRGYYIPNDGMTDRSYFELEFPWG